MLQNQNMSRQYNRDKDIEWGLDPTTYPILYERHAISDWLIQVSAF